MNELLKLNNHLPNIAAELDVDLRYELKAKIFLSPQEVKSILFNNPQFIRTLYPTRQIHNIYYDTPTFDYYHENLSGLSQRKKVRARFYGNSLNEFSSPKIEIKFKQGLLGYKKFIDLGEFKYFENNSFQINNYPTIFPEAKLSELLPVLRNSYHRDYFQDESKKVRLTLDYHLSFKKIKMDQTETSQIDTHRILNHFVILEIKYNLKDAKQGELIKSLLPFHFSKFSKYCFGIDQVY